MEKIEELKKKAVEIKPDVDAKQSEAEQEKGELAAQEKEATEKLEAERKILQEKMQGINSEFIGKYEVARSRNPDAVAYINQGTCEGCYLSIPPQLAIEVQRLTDLHACPNCQRLLFIQEAEEESEETADASAS